METFLKRQTYIEEKYKKIKSNRNAFALIEGYWVCYKMAGDIGFLHKAYHAVVKITEKDFSSAEYFFLAIFLDIEIGNLDRAKDLLNKIKPYKNYYKNNDIQSYASYIFLLSFYYIKINKKNSAEKQYKILSQINEQTPNYIFNVMLGLLDSEFKYYRESIINLSKGYINGARSSFTFYTMLECVENNSDVIYDMDYGTMLGFISWVLNKNIEISGLIERINDIAKVADSKNISLLERLYKKYHHNDILIKICSYYISKEDLSVNAFYFYKEVQQYGLDIAGLNIIYIKSALMHGDENISGDNIEKFLQLGITDRELLAFAYHILITKFDGDNLLSVHRQEIILFAKENILKNESGRFLNSIYVFYLSQADNDKALIEQAEKLVYNDLFKYRLYIDNSNVNYILVREKEIGAMREYSNIGKARVIICSSQYFVCEFFDRDKRIMPGFSFRFVRLVENADISLYRRFFDKGLYSVELLVSLSNYYMGLSNLPSNAVDVLKMTLTNQDISNEYRLIIGATIGTYYYNIGEHKKALLYYDSLEDILDEDLLINNFIDKILLAYINSGNYKMAISIITKKSGIISDKALFYAIKWIIDDGEYAKEISRFSYGIILNGWYDKALLINAINNYSLSQCELYNLSKILSDMSIYEKEIDMLILQNSVFMHIFDKGSQEAFLRIYENREEVANNQLLNDYLAFCLYEIIINNANPEYKMIELLENNFISSGQSIIGYALCHVYICHDITTAQSDKIIKLAFENCEKDKIILPVFKVIKDKNKISPYIESNQPFIYHGPTDRDIKLYYRIDGETEYKKINMIYFMFGIYFVNIPSFYGEKIIYYFSDELKTGSITTKEETVENNDIRVSEILDDNELYYKINNALIYEKLQEYDKVEEIISKMLAEKPRIKGWIL